MELYDRFAKTTHGWHDIDCMPPEIRAEYAKHNYHPRFRDMKSMGVGTIVLTPLLYALGGLAFITISSIKSWLNRMASISRCSLAIVLYHKAYQSLRSTGGYDV